ncbi:MAG TPA: hypothetical protein VFW94_09420 [Candidatus Acidoferrales bacterium]|nr:hypothetical protein [Candidatus Acidoferrales bacterium]
MIKSSSGRGAYLLLAVALCATLLFAENKPWKSKPFEQWDAKDVQQIMTRSPWVRVTTVPRSWLSAAEKNVPPEEQISGGIRSMPGPAGAASRGSEESQRQLNAYVYWDSAHVMREASARNAMLHGMMKDAEAEQYASAPEEEYQLVLYMADMTPFLKNDEKFFLDKAYIETKRGKLKLPPSQIKYDRDSSGRLKDVIFFFPKKTSSGNPTVISTEKEITFECKFGRGSGVHVIFDVQQMSGPAGLDL